MDSITYGELMQRAVGHTHAAWAHLHEDPVPDEHDARQTVLAFRELVHALAGLSRLHLRRATSPPTTPLVRPPGDPRLRAATGFTTALTVAGDTPRPQFHHMATGGIADDLRTAVVAVRAATELLSTHVSDEGHWRTPESAVLDDVTTRLGALDAVAGLATELADAHPLVLRFATAAGVTPAWIHRRLPELAAVRETARELRSLLWPPTDPVAISAATIANPGIRTGEPLTELADRIARMHRTAWRGAAYPHRESGVPMLISLATAATMVHGRAAIVAARIAGTRVRDPHAPNHVKSLLALTDSWRTIRAQVSILNSASLPDPILTQDVAEVRRLLEELTFDYALEHLPGGHEVTFTTTIPPDHLLAALTENATAFAQIAQWNSQTISYLSKSGLLHLPGGLLTGAEMSEQPDRITARFIRTSVLAPRGRIHALRTAYETVRGNILHISPTAGLPATPPPDLWPGI